MPLRVLLADDHNVVREGLAALLADRGFVVVGEAADGREAAQMALELKPDVTVLDISMPVLNGMDAARSILRHEPRMAVVLLTMHDEDAYVIEALRAGVKGYVLKSQAVADLAKAIHEASHGSIYLSPGISRNAVERRLTESAAPQVPLTPRERAILQLVAEGRTTKEIAEDLAISARTCEAHRIRIMKKLRIHHVAGLVRYAIRKGLISP